MSKYLLEIGTEELPYKFIPSAIQQLKTGFENFLNNNKINFEKVNVYATPRRLAVIVDDIAKSSPDEVKVVKGPIKKVAFDENGNLTKAGEGFLNKNGLTKDDAYIENDYLHAKVVIKGKASKLIIDRGEVFLRDCRLLLPGLQLQRKVLMIPRTVEMLRDRPDGRFYVNGPPHLLRRDGKGVARPLYRGVHSLLHKGHGPLFQNSLCLFLIQFKLLTDHGRFLFQFLQFSVPGEHASGFSVIGRLLCQLVHIFVGKTEFIQGRRGVSFVRLQRYGHRTVALCMGLQGCSRLFLVMPDTSCVPMYTLSQITSLSTRFTQLKRYRYTHKKIRRSAPPHPARIRRHLCFFFANLSLLSLRLLRRPAISSPLVPAYITSDGMMDVATMATITTMMMTAMILLVFLLLKSIRLSPYIYLYRPYIVYVLFSFFNMDCCPVVGQRVSFPVVKKHIPGRQREVFQVGHAPELISIHALIAFQIAAGRRLLLIKPAHPFRVRLWLSRKRRAALRIFTQIVIKNERFPQRLLFPGAYALAKSEEELISGRSGMLHPLQAFFLIAGCKLPVKGKRRRKIFLKKQKRMFELAAVVVDFRHLLHPFQNEEIRVGKPPGEQHLIGRRIPADKAVLLLFLLHAGALEHLEEAKLQLIRPHGVDAVKRAPEAFQVLARKPRDQVQVLVYIGSLPDPPHRALQLCKIHAAPDLPDGLRVRGLNADLQLNEPGAHRAKEREFLLIQQICRDLEMEVCDAVVVLFYKTPDLHRVIAPAVKGAVHKLDLRCLLLQEKTELFFYKGRTPKPKFFIYGREAIAAGKRTSPAALIVEDPVSELCHVCIDKGNAVQFHRFPPGIFPDPAIAFPVCDAPDPLQIRLFSLGPGLRQFREGLFPLSPHHAADARVFHQYRRRAVGYLGTAQPDLRFREHLFHFREKPGNHVHVPDIAGETEHLRGAPEKIRQDRLRLLVDGILRDPDPVHPAGDPLPGIPLQAVDCQVGVYVFCIDCR